MNRLTENNPPGPNAARFTLVELLLLMGFASVSFALMSGGLVMLGLCFLATVICFRTSMVDFSPIGGAAVLLTIVFGTMSIGMLVLWSAGF